MLQEKYVARVESLAAVQNLHMLDEKEALGALFRVWGLVFSV